MSAKSKLECLPLQSLLKVKKAINLDVEMSHNKLSHYVPLPQPYTQIREYLRGKYHCTINLLHYWFGLICFAKKVSCHTAESKPVKQEVNSTAILPPLVLPAQIFYGPKILKRD
jgi:hypothetical protein